MRTMKYILSMLVAMFAFGGCERFNRLVEYDQTAGMSWSNYEAELQRRSDLVPALVNTVKGSAGHENKTLVEVQQARSEATQIKLSADDLTDPAKVAAFEAAQNKLKGSLSRLMMVQEQYPDLKAMQSFHSLQIQLESTENRILRARQTYNKDAKNFNVELLRIGGRVTNQLTGKEFRPRVYFTADPTALTAPPVDFSAPPAPKAK